MEVNINKFDFIQQPYSEVLTLANKFEVVLPLTLDLMR